jgi:hypothetical protein
MTLRLGYDCFREYPSFPSNPARVNPTPWKSSCFLSGFGVGVENRFHHSRCPSDDLFYGPRSSGNAD